jgi:exonuclease III
MTSNSPTYKSLLILRWNANSLHNHLNDLQLTLHEKRIDIALLSETHLTTRNKIYILSYTFLHTNHPDDSAHGGAAIFIKSSILFHPLPPYNESHIQANSIQITLDHTPIIITSTYCPPRHTISPLQFDTACEPCKENVPIF